MAWRAWCRCRERRTYSEAARGGTSDRALWSGSDLWPLGRVFRTGRHGDRCGSSTHGGRDASRVVRRHRGVVIDQRGMHRGPYVVLRPEHKEFLRERLAGDGHPMSIEILAMIEHTYREDNAKMRTPHP